MKLYVNVVGAGLAGCEAAYQIAKCGIFVKLYEMKPNQYTMAHSNPNFAEIVCSNSLKSNLITNACGLLKEELRLLDSLLIRLADENKVPAGQALAVDREKFATEVTKQIKNHPNIEIISEEVGKEITLEQLLKEAITIVATGPLTSSCLTEQIKQITGQKGLFFYDAAAPIVTRESIDFSVAFWADRYGKGESNYLNLPMKEEEYNAFYNALVLAEVVTLHEFEKREIFEGCMPIEVMAKRGKDTLRFGPLKPVGFTDPRTGKRPYAIVQLRQENNEGTLFNVVGFQTNLKFAEQKKVLRLIPGLQEVDIAKYGVMHRNTYIDSPKLLDSTYQMEENSNLYFAGQITGVEGYVESISSGMVAGINAVRQIQQQDRLIFPKETMIGMLATYISTPKENFQPMNANFGILPPLVENIRDKKQRYEKLAKRALIKIERSKEDK